MRNYTRQRLKWRRGEPCPDVRVPAASAFPGIRPDLTNTTLPRAKMAQKLVRALRDGRLPNDTLEASYCCDGPAHGPAFRPNAIYAAYTAGNHYADLLDHRRLSRHRIAGAPPDATTIGSRGQLPFKMARVQHLLSCATDSMSRQGRTRDGPGHAPRGEGEQHQVRPARGS